MWYHSSVGTFSQLQVMGATGTKEEGASGAKEPKASPAAQPAAAPGSSTRPSSAPRASQAGKVLHEAFIVDNPDPINNHYSIEKKKLGEGSYGTVSKGKCKQTGAIRAVKSISKAHMKDAEKFKREIQIMKQMDHPYIIKLYETFDDHKNIYLILELCSGGELFDRIIEAGHFTEKQAAHLMMQTLSGIYYCHQIGICHRDIKPENFLFYNKDPIEKSTLKIIDFGLSCSFTPGQVLKTKAGTPYYVAPQVLEGKYDQACDLWSCGVIMFVLLCGYPPFHGDTDNEVLRKVRAANLVFDPVDWEAVSSDAKELIKKLLKKDPKERYTAAQAVDDVWIKERAPRAANAPLTSGLVDNLRGFRSQNKLKKAALHVIASQLNEEQIKALRNTFMTLDENGDGLLTAAELTKGLQKAGFKEVPADLQKIMEEVDSDGSGVIDYTEFLAATIDKKVFMQEDVCWAAFRVFDRNGDGKISKDELKSIIGDEHVTDAMHHTAETVEELMKEIDTNGDGEIDFKEFMQMMRGGAGK